MNGRQVFATWFGLVVLYTVITRAGQVGGALGGLTTALDKLSDPSVPLIPDRRTSSGATPATTAVAGSSWDVPTTPNTTATAPTAPNYTATAPAPFGTPPNLITTTPTQGS